MPELNFPKNKFPFSPHFCQYIVISITTLIKFTPQLSFHFRVCLLFQVFFQLLEFSSSWFFFFCPAASHSLQLLLLHFILWFWVTLAVSFCICCFAIQTKQKQDQKIKQNSIADCFIQPLFVLPVKKPEEWQFYYVFLILTCICLTCSSSIHPSHI